MKQRQKRAPLPNLNLKSKMQETGYTLQELADKTKSTAIGDLSCRIFGVEELESATPREISFCANTRYTPLLQTTQAGAVCIDKKTHPLPGKNFLVCDNPSQTFQTLIELFLQERRLTSAFTGIHPTAVIHPTAKIGKNVYIGPFCVIDADCVVGDHSFLAPSVTLARGVKLGEQCHLHAHVTIENGCILHNRVIIQAGAVIGSCGFGYTTTPQGEHLKQEQLGIVVLEDDVEIGANTTLDRARFKETRIKKGTKIDNLVQIAHNVEIGPYNLIVSQTGISGSVKTGHHVVMGGQTGTVGHIEVAPGALFAARSGIKKSITQAGKYGGNPAIPLEESQRQQVHLKRLATYVKRLEALEKKIT